MQTQDTALIPLRARDGSVRAYAIVDAADAEWVNQWRWSITEGYPCRTTSPNGGRSRYTVYLHRLILGLKRGDGLEADHIDRNRLNCRRSNLRVVSRIGNAQNVGGKRGRTSPHRGVYWRADRQKWRAEIEVNYKRINLGCFDSEDEAAQAAKSARLRLMTHATD